VTAAAHPDPPLREELAREMFGLARTGPGPIAWVDKTRLHNYALLAEEIIQLQSRMLVRDQAQRDTQYDEITRLRTENASLRQLAEAELRRIAAEFGAVPIAATITLKDDLTSRAIDDARSGS